MTESLHKKPVSRTFPSEQLMMDAAAEELTVAAQQAVHARGRCVLALDASPLCLHFYAHWVARTVAHAFWSYALVFQAREDALQGSGASNSRGAANEFSIHFPVPSGHVFGINDSEMSDPDAAAQRYERTIRMVLELRPHERPTFDMVFLEVDGEGRMAGLAVNEWDAREPSQLVRSARVGRSVSLSPYALASTRQMLLVRPRSLSVATTGLGNSDVALDRPLNVPAALASRHIPITILNAAGN